jgi:hypothetical protein
MTDSPVATDVHQTLDVHLDHGTELTFNLVFLVDGVTDGSHLVVIPLSDLDVTVDSTLVENLLCGAATDSEDIGQTYLSSFVIR